MWANFSAWLLMFGLAFGVLAAPHPFKTDAQPNDAGYVARRAYVIEGGA
jgi:hypothetical protein